MKPAEVKAIVIKKVDDMVMYANEVNDTFSVDALHSFRIEFRIIRSFINFVYLQRSDKAMKMPEKCKELYRIVSLLSESLGSMEAKQSQSANTEDVDKIINKAKREWKAIYSESILLKLKKRLEDYDYSKINPDLMNNFFRNVASAILRAENEI